MILNPIRRAYGPLSRLTFANQTRAIKSLRPTVKIGKECFQITLDVRQFKKDEIKVKAHPEYVIIEGKHEMLSDRGYILRHFVKKFKLPQGCVPQKIKSTLSPEGILTVFAPRAFNDAKLPCETVAVPIRYGPPDKLKETDDIKASAKTQQDMKKKEDAERAARVKKSCAEYPKVKPRPPN